MVLFKKSLLPKVLCTYRETYHCRLTSQQIQLPFLVHLVKQTLFKGHGRWPTAISWRIHTVMLTFNWFLDGHKFKVSLVDSFDFCRKSGKGKAVVFIYLPSLEMLKVWCHLIFKLQIVREPRVTVGLHMDSNLILHGDLTLLKPNIPQTWKHLRSWA